MKRGSLPLPYFVNFELICSCYEGGQFNFLRGLFIDVHFVAVYLLFLRTDFLLLSLLSPFKLVLPFIAYEGLFISFGCQLSLSLSLFRPLRENISGKEF